MATQPYRRRQHLIKKEFQIRFIVKFCLIVLAGVLLSTALLFFLSQDTLTSTFDQSRLVIRKTGSAILPAILYTNLITLAVISGITIFVTLYISHKIAGPMFRFEKELKEIAQGNLRKKIVLRKHDQVKGMADSLNTMTDSLHAKVSEIRNEIKLLEKCAHEKEAPVEVTRGLQELNRKLNRSFTL